MMEQDATLVGGIWNHLLGVPYVPGGRSQNVGFDCLGLVLAGLRVLGIELSDPWPRLEERWAEGWREVGEIAPDGFVRIDPSPQDGLWPRPFAFREGDVLVTGSHGIPQHLGLAIDAHSGLHIRRLQFSRLIPHEVFRDHLLWAWRPPR